ncbi:MAG: RHS repeat-associated core domain-containing protein [Caldilineaceae bacterium]
MQLQHRGGNVERWTRRYQYALDSNRLLATSLPNDPADEPTYLAAPTYSAKHTYDAHGNMTTMLHLPTLAWDFQDQLQMTQRQSVDNGGNAAKTYYVYDANGQRVRKVTETANGQRKEERIYLGTVELYRQSNNQALTLERETLHVMDDNARIALIETRTRATINDPAPRQLIRYQLSNHLGSATLELDAAAQIISYEEYHPYGTTAYQASRSQTDTPKRYRYTGKERDEETGFSYHGARYYAPWLGRWTSCDPKGVVDTNNLYVYVRCTPTIRTDPDGMQSSPVNTTVSNPLLDKKYQTVSTAQQHRNRTKSTSWEETHANDLSAPVGTPVYAATSGHIVYIVHDARQRHEGPIFGDQVWIRTNDDKIESFYTHIDLTPEILNEIKEKGEEKNGRVSASVNIKIARGAKIGSVTTWDTNPNGSHLHFSMALRKGKKDYQGIDPEQILTATRDTALGRQVTVSDSGSYTVSSQTEPTLPNLPQLSLTVPEIPTFAEISISRTPRLVPELASPSISPLPQTPAIGTQLSVPSKTTMPKIKIQFKQREAENWAGPKLKPIFHLSIPE